MPIRTDFENNNNNNENGREQIQTNLIESARSALRTVAIVCYGVPVKRQVGYGGKICGFEFC